MNTTSASHASRADPAPSAALDGPTGIELKHISGLSTPGMDHASVWKMVGLVLDVTPQPAFWKDRDLIFQGCNAAFSKITGHTQQDIIGKSESDLYTRTVAEKNCKYDKQVIETGKPLHEIETVQISHDGKQSWLSVSKLPLSDATGNIIGVLGSLRDISQQKLAEDAWQASEERFAVAFERSAGGMFVAAANDGGFIQVNTAFCDMLGYTQEELQGKSFEQLAHPDDLETGFDRLDQLMAGEVSSALVEKRYQHKDGDDVWMLISAAMTRDQNDQPLHVISQVQDISERKLAEKSLKESDERLRVLFEYAPDAYFLMDRSGNFIDGNIAAEKLTGFHRMELFRHNFFDVGLLSATDMQTLSKCLIDITQHKAVGPDEFNLYRKDGTLIPIELRSFPVTLQGLPVVLTIARDTSERKEAESRLADLNQQLLVQSRQAGMAEVATTVLHNVGNVLNSINVSSSLVTEKIRKSHVSSLPRITSLLKEHEDDLGGFFTTDAKGLALPGYLNKLSNHLEEERQQVMDELELLGNNIEHIKEIIAMQQTYTKISSVIELTDISELLEDSLRMNQRAIDRHHIEVIREYSSAPAIEIEKHKVMQVLVNLIQNAKCACADAECEAPLLKLQVEHDEHQITISVIDNGIGIDPEIAYQLFNYGFTTREGGNGFGLYSSALAAKELGGSLTACSDGPGQGATFTLSLPIPGEQASDE